MPTFAHPQRWGPSTTSPLRARQEGVLRPAFAPPWSTRSTNSGADAPRLRAQGRARDELRRPAQRLHQHREGNPGEPRDRLRARVRPLARRRAQDAVARQGGRSSRDAAEHHHGADPVRPRAAHHDPRDDRSGGAVRRGRVSLHGLRQADVVPSSGASFDSLSRRGSQPFRATVEQMKPAHSSYQLTTTDPDHRFFTDDPTAFTNNTVLRWTYRQHVRRTSKSRAADLNSIQSNAVGLHRVAEQRRRSDGDRRAVVRTGRTRERRPGTPSRSTTSWTGGTARCSVHWRREHHDAEHPPGGANDYLYSDGGSGHPRKAPSPGISASAR